MFDIGFWEVLVIVVVALLVLGPERMTKTARVIGRLVAKLRKEINTVKKSLD